MCRTLHALPCSVLLLILLHTSELHHAPKYSSRILASVKQPRDNGVHHPTFGVLLQNKNKTVNNMEIDKFDSQFLNNIKPYLIVRKRISSKVNKTLVNSSNVDGGNDPHKATIIKKLLETLQNQRNGVNLTENSDVYHNLNNTEDGIKASWPVKMMRCFRAHRNIVKCMKRLFLQQLRVAVEKSEHEKVNITQKWFEDLFTADTNGVQLKSSLEDLKDSELDEQIVTTLLKVFDRADLNFYLLPGITMHLTPADRGNHTINLAIRAEELESEDARKSKIKMSDLYPFMLAPPMIMAGILPLLLPGIKMAVMTVTMLNQMVFMSALFSLIRGYIFDPRPSDRVVYVNYGYKDEPMNEYYSKYNEQFQFENT